MSEQKKAIKGLNACICCGAFYSTELTDSLQAELAYAEARLSLIKKWMEEMSSVPDKLDELHGILYGKAQAEIEKETKQPMSSSGVRKGEDEGDHPAQYVDHWFGDDAFGDGTFGNPFKTIKRATDECIAQEVPSNKDAGAVLTYQAWKPADSVLPCCSLKPNEVKINPDLCLECEHLEPFETQGDYSDAAYRCKRWGFEIGILPKLTLTWENKEDEEQPMPPCYNSKTGAIHTNPERCLGCKHLKVQEEGTGKYFCTRWSFDLTIRPKVPEKKE